MFRDANDVIAGEALHFDICIIGAGVAGTTLASNLDGSGLSVALFESGSLTGSSEVQELYEGVNVGLPYYPLDTARSRQFGGSPNRWLLELGDGSIGARLFPLDPMDFEKRDWVPNSGWPFDFAHMRSFYSRAAEFLEISPRGFTEDAWKSGNGHSGLPFADDEAYSKVYQCVRRDFFIDKCRDKLAASENISVYLNANVLEIETDSAGEAVSRLSIQTLQGKQLSASGKVFVLAAGAIESARLLLLSRARHEAGLGNQNDLVGRYFMEHPHLWEGTFVPTDRRILRYSRFYSNHIDRSGFPIIAQISLSEATQREHQLLNHAIVLKAAPKPPKSMHDYPLSGGINAIKGAIGSFARGDLDQASRHLSTIVPVAGAVSIRFYRRAMKLTRKIVDLRKNRVFRLNYMAEQIPNPASRVSLDSDTDKFGQQRVQLDWRLTEQDVASIKKSLELLDAKFRKAGLGHVVHQMSGHEPPEGIHGGWHHMGTTRMHDNPKLGVTDHHGKVHGTSNLYVAGSSNFPTSGSANPAFTIVALAIRLADKLRKEAQPAEIINS